MKNASTHTKNRLRARLRAWLEMADVCDTLAGKAWYGDARAFCEALSKTYHTPFARVCGVLAALSPATRWDVNKRQTENLVRAHSEGGDLEEVIVSTYGKQAVKAREILLLDTMDSLSVRRVLGLRAFKTKAFFDNICLPKRDSVTIDRHIINAAGFEESWVQAAVWCYEMLADCIRDLAKELDWRPCQVQAVVWITYKRIVGADDRRISGGLPF